MHLIPRWRAALCLLFLAALWIAACDKDGITEPDAPNRTPVTSGAIPAQTLEADGTVTLDLSSWFNDPDGDRLTYSAQSSDPGIATVSVSGNTLTIQAAAQKTGKHAPATIPAEAPRAPDVSPHRSPDRLDPEHEGDTGALEALYKERAANAEATGSAWTAAAATDETVTITVTARDPDGLSASQTFDVTVETAEAENQGPVAVGTIPAQAVEAGRTVDVDAKPWFSDPDDDMLSYEAASQNVAVATVATAGNVVTVTGIAEGDTQIDITARDPAGLSAKQTFDVTVSAATQENQGPVAVGTIPAQAVEAGRTVDVDAKPWFSDPDDDMLSYEAASQNVAVATVAAAGNVVTVTGIAEGDTQIDITARDPAGLSAKQTFDVTVSAAVQVISVCNRTPQVRDQIVQATGSSGCANIKSQALATITKLYLQGGQGGGNNLTALQAGDFNGLINLTELQLYDNELTELPPNIFDDLTRLIELNLSNNQLRELPAGVFSNLMQLENLNLTSNQIAALPDGIFTGLSKIKQLWAHANPLGSIPLHLNMQRTDSDDLLAQGPAVIDIRLAEGFPITMEIPLSISGGTLSANSIVLESGQEISREVTVTRDANGSSGVRITPGDIAPLRTNAITGLHIVSPEPLTLFGSTANNPPVVFAQFPAMYFQAGDAPKSVRGANHFRDADGGALTYAATAADPNVASVEVAGDLITVRPQGGGSTKITVTATDTDNLSAEAILQASVREDRPGSFHIELIYMDEEVRVLESVFQRAANRWMTILANMELPDVPYREEIWRDCLRIPANHQTTVDDLAIALQVTDFGGAGLAAAGSCSLREDSNLPITGIVLLNRSAIPGMQTNGTLEHVILHEMGHVLGIGDSWSESGLLRNVARSFNERRTDTHFAGPLAIQAYDEAGGTNYPNDPKVPVDENGAHWKMEMLQPEFMIGTTYPNMHHPVSAITIQALADLGYVVDINQAEPYTLPGAIASKQGNAQAIPYGDDIRKGPIRVVDRNGRTVRIIPPRE